MFRVTAKAIAILRYRGPAVAECDGCDKLHPEATRERCRVHVQQTGHVVRFTVEDVTRYSRSRQAVRGDPQEDGPIRKNGG